MEVRRVEFKFYLLQFHAPLEGSRSFVIEELEDGFQSAFCDDLTKFGVGAEKLVMGSAKIALLS